MIIKRNNQEIKCELSLIDGDSLYPEYKLKTICRGWKNEYTISTKICGLNECKEKSLYFSVWSVTCLNLDNTNEETLIDEAIEDIFSELTQENY
tara:strand:- start:569 stop:850 length:282 start_codon:yes stop_codon:yes gene_type:complete